MRAMQCRCAMPANNELVGGALDLLAGDISLAGDGLARTGFQRFSSPKKSDIATLVRTYVRIWGFLRLFRHSMPLAPGHNTKTFYLSDK